MILNNIKVRELIQFDGRLDKKIRKKKIKIIPRFLSYQLGA